MRSWLSKTLDSLSNFLASRKGLLPLMGVAMIFLNFLLGVFSQGWLASSNLFLHLGVIIAILGFMLAWAL